MRSLGLLGKHTQEELCWTDDVIYKTTMLYASKLNTNFPNCKRLTSEVGEVAESSSRLPVAIQNILALGVAKATH